MTYYDMVFSSTADVLKKSSLYMYVYVNGSYLYVYRHNADEAMAK